MSDFDNRLVNLMKIIETHYDESVDDYDKRSEIDDNIRQVQVRFYHNCIILCNLWVCIEMYQYFKNELKELIYNTLYTNNNCFKYNDNNSKIITSIIIDMIIQNFDDDFNKCFRNNNNFSREIAKFI